MSPQFLICTPSLPSLPTAPHGHSPPHCTPPTDDPPTRISVTHTHHKTSHIPSHSQLRPPDGLGCAPPREATGRSSLLHPHSPTRLRRPPCTSCHRPASPHCCGTHPCPFVGVLVEGLRGPPIPPDADRHSTRRRRRRRWRAGLLQEPSGSFSLSYCELVVGPRVPLTVAAKKRARPSP